MWEMARNLLTQMIQCRFFMNEMHKLAVCLMFLKLGMYGSRPWQLSILTSSLAIMRFHLHQDSGFVS
jgi:hypothetical protein